MLGGNLASRCVGERVHLDVYPHMYLNWYHNFWALLADVDRRDREQLFRPMQGVKQLRAGDYPRYTGLTNPYRPWNLPQNMLDGPTPPADLYLFFYAAIDLMAERLHPTLTLDDVSVNGFLHARPYMTERTAELFNNLIINVWGIPSYLASADDYQDFLEYSVADPSPPFWLARGSAHEQVIAPLEAKLAGAGRRDRARDAGRQRHVRGGPRARDRPARQPLGPGARLGAARRPHEAVDELVLARAARRPVARSCAPASRARSSRRRRGSPRSSRLSAQHVPLAAPLLQAPRCRSRAEPVGLAGSRFGLAFTDISQTWQDVPDFAGAGRCSRSPSSDPFGLPGHGRRGRRDGDAARGCAAISTFDAGDGWGDSRDIDWERTTLREQRRRAAVRQRDRHRRLAAEGGRRRGWRTSPTPATYCDNRIGMTTIESAVTSGLEAAAAIVARRGGTPVEIHEPRALPARAVGVAALACMPYAASASAWSKGSDLLADAAARRPSALRELPDLVDERAAAAPGSSANRRASARAESAIRSRTRSASSSCSRQAARQAARAAPGRRRRSRTARGSRDRGSPAPPAA